MHGAHRCITAGETTAKQTIKIQAYCGGHSSDCDGSPKKKPCECPLNPDCVCKPQNCETDWSPWGACGPAGAKKPITRTRSKKVIKEANGCGECTDDGAKET